MKDYAIYNKKRYERGFLIFDTKEDAKKEASKQRKIGYDIIIDKNRKGYFYWVRENFSKIPNYDKITKQEKIKVITKKIKELKLEDEHYDYQIKKDPSNKLLYKKKMDTAVKIHNLKKKRLRLKRGK